MTILSQHGAEDSDSTHPFVTGLISFRIKLHPPPTYTLFFFLNKLKW